MFQRNPNVKGHWKSNYKAVPKEMKISPDGLSHHSVAEKDRWVHLLTLQQAGYISELERQIPMNLVLPNGVEVRSLVRRRKSKKTGKVTFPGDKLITYNLDFRYRNKAGTIIHEEYKGHMTEKDELKLAVVQAIYQIKIHICKSPKGKVGGDV